MAKKNVVVPTEVIQSIQKDFELDSYEMANLFGISMSSTLDWLKNGVRGQRGHNLALIDSLLALKYLNKNDPEHFMTFDQLKSIIKRIVKTPGLIYVDFAPVEDELGPAMEPLKHQKLVSAIMAILYVFYLKSKGKEIMFKEIKEVSEKTALYDRYRK